MTMHKELKYIDDLKKQLEDHQKEISELKTANDFLIQENQTLKDLAGKIEAANKIIAHFRQVEIDERGLNGMDWWNAFRQLEKALQIPRIDEHKPEDSLTRKRSVVLEHKTENGGSTPPPRIPRKEEAKSHE